MSLGRWATAIVVASLAASACTQSHVTSTSLDSEQHGTLTMPEPEAGGDVSLEETLAARRSVRSYTDDPLSLEEISQLMWAAQGLTEPGGAGRTAPSAGGTYPLEIYVATHGGVYHYLPRGHTLEVVDDTDVRESLAAAALDQEWVATAAAVVVITAVFSRTEQRYGARATRYVHLEAGHAAQNILLQAVALDLGAVPVGAFDDDRVRAAVHAGADHEPLYLIPVGHPAEE
jgi:SagB-type dehydrogenase family enzyme